MVVILDVRKMGALLALTCLLCGAPVAKADVATTGTFGIDVSVGGFPPSGTFDGQITGFDLVDPVGNPFSVGGVPVDLANDIVDMSIVNGNIPTINIPALAASFDFQAVDNGSTLSSLGFMGDGLAVCTDAFTCVQGQGTFVGDMSNIIDPDALLPDATAYTFDGTVVVDGVVFDASGRFGINAFEIIPVGAGLNAFVTSDLTTFYDSRADTLRDYIVDLTFAEVMNPGMVSFLGKSAIPGALPANIGLNADVSVFIDIVTGGGLAFTPPVEVCVHYDDFNPMDGVVDGTSVMVDELKLLHALALGDNFQDTTTSVGGGVVCGQVGSLSPFVVGVGPPFTATTSTTLAGSTTSTTLDGGTTTSTTVAPSTTTTTSTIPAGLVPGGPPKKTDSDCYQELLIVGVENKAPQVEKNKKVLCTDGTACDTDGLCNNICTLQIASCINQVDPNLPDCTPPAMLEQAKIKVKGKTAINIQVPQLLTGSVCGAFVTVAVEAKFNKKGKYKANKSKVKANGTAKAPKGTKPRKDKDKWQIQCLPNTNPASCPPVGSPSGAFLRRR